MRKTTTKIEQIACWALLVAFLAISSLAGDAHNHLLAGGHRATGHVALVPPDSHSGHPGEGCIACQWSSHTAGRPAPAGVMPALVVAQPVISRCAPASRPLHTLPASPRAPPSFSLL